jgi:hypothetical protein
MHLFLIPSLLISNFFGSLNSNFSSSACCTRDSHSYFRCQFITTSRCRRRSARRRRSPRRSPYRRRSRRPCSTRFSDTGRSSVWRCGASMHAKFPTRHWQKVSHFNSIVAFLILLETFFSFVRIVIAVFPTLVAPDSTAIASPSSSGGPRSSSCWWSRRSRRRSSPGSAQWSPADESCAPTRPRNSALSGIYLFFIRF